MFFQIAPCLQISKVYHLLEKKSSNPPAKKYIGKELHWSYTTFLQQVCKYYCSGVSCIQSVPKTYFLYKSVANKWSLSWFAVIAVTGFLAFISPFTICRNIYLHYFMFMYIAQLNNIIFCHGDSKKNVVLMK